MTNRAQALQLAVQHHQAGQLADARAIYEEIPATQPDALNFMGVLAQQNGELAGLHELT